MTNSPVPTAARMALRLNTAIDIDRDPDWVFGELHDTETLVRCVPGVTLTRLIDSNRFEACLVAGIGPFTVGYAGTGRILESDPRARTSSLRLKGVAGEMGSADARMTMVVKPNDLGSTVNVSVQLGVTGHARLLGRDLIERFAGEMLAHTGRQLKRQLENTPGHATA